LGKAGEYAEALRQEKRLLGVRRAASAIRVDYTGHTRYASEDDPQYEIKSTKTDHIAMHKGQSFIFASRDGRASQSGAVFRCVEIVKPTPDARYAVFHSVGESSRRRRLLRRSRVS
jgi:hypothetical protein